MKPRILVIDDEPAIRDTMKMTLEYDGVYATPTYTGDMFVEAIYNDLVRTSPPPAPAGASAKGKPAPKGK